VERIFRGWSGDVTSIVNPLTLTITADTAVIANFDTRQVFMPMAVRP
jgi:hypothetical protein